MTVADNTSRNQYTATNLQVSFAYTFEIVDKDDIVVLKNGTTLSEGADYTVFNVGNDNGGTIELTSGATAGDILTLYRDMPYARTQNYTNSGDFLASEVNSDFDNLWLAGEQTNRSFSQSIRKPITDSDSISMELPEAADRADKLLGFDTNGAPSTVLVTGDAQTIVDIAGDIKTLAEIQDGTVATDAITNVNDIRTDVTAVSNNEANVTTVATDIANVNTTAGSIANVNTVATDIANVNIVAPDIANVNTTATNIADVNTVATDLSGADNVGTVAGNIADVNTVAGISTDVTEVANNEANINAVAVAIPDIYAANARQSIYPDPIFEFVNNGTGLSQGFNGYDLISGNWVYDATFSSPFRRGAWKHDSTSSSLSFWHVDWALSAPQDILQPGDTFSVGALVQASAGGAGRLTHRFVNGSKSNYVTPQVTEPFVGTGDVQVVQMNAQTVPTSVTNTGITFYFYDATPATDIHILAMWIIKGDDAGVWPPGFRSVPQLTELVDLLDFDFKTDIATNTSDISTLETELDAAEVNIGRNEDYLNTVIPKQEIEPLHNAHVYSSGEGDAARAFSSTFVGWANPFQWDGTAFDTVKVYCGVENANSRVRVTAWYQNNTLAGQGYGMMPNNEGYVTVTLDQRVTGSSQIMYIAIQTIDGTTRLMPSTQVAGFTNVPDTTTYPQKYLVQGAGREFYTITEWSSVTGSGTGWPIDFKLYDSGNDQKTLPRLQPSAEAMNQLLTTSAPAMFDTDDTTFQNGTLTGYVGISSTFSGWAQAFDWDGTAFDMIRVGFRVETAGHPVRISIYSGDRTHMVASSIITPLQTEGYFYAKLDTRVEHPRFNRSIYDTLYVAVESLNHEVRMGNSSGTGIIHPSDTSTYPQLYTLTTSTHTSLSQWSPVTGAGTSRPLIFGLYDSEAVDLPTETLEEFIDTTKEDIGRNEDYLNTVIPKQEITPIHNAYVFNNCDGDNARAFSSTFTGWANPIDWDATAFDTIKIYVGAETANSRLRVSVWKQDNTLAAQGYGMLPNTEGYLTVHLDNEVSASLGAQVLYIAIQSIDGTTRVMPSDDVTGHTNVADPATYPQKYITQGAGKEFYTISQWAAVSGNTGFPIDFKLYNSTNDQKTVPADQAAFDSLNQLMTSNASTMFDTSQTAHSNGTQSGYQSIVSTFTGWAQPFDWDGTAFDIARVAFRVEETGHPVRISIWTGDKTDMIASGIVTPFKTEGYFYVKLDNRVEEPRYDASRYNTLYIAAESLNREVKMANSTGSGNSNPADTSTYPQLYVTTTSGTSLTAWSTVSGAGTSRPLFFDLYDSADLALPTDTPDTTLLTAPASGEPVVTPRHFGIEDIEMNVYMKDAISGTGDHVFNFNGITNSEQLHERWTYMPTSTAVNGSSLTLEVRDPNELTSKSSKSYSVYTCAANGAAGATRRICAIGDSTTAGGVWTGRVLSQATANVNGVQPTMVGTEGTAPNLHEGRGGWSVARYYQPSGADVAENPFVQNAGDKFNAAYYLSSTGQSAPDIVIWHLGINDVFGQSSDAGVNSIMDTFLSRLDEMIGVTVAADVGSWKESNANVTTLVAVPISPAGSQDAFGDDYDTGQYRDRYKRNITVAAHRIVEHYKNSESDNIYLLPWNIVLDPERSFPTTTAATSQYFTDNITRQNNGVHPATTGYYQMGDCAWAAINVLVTNGNA